MNELSIKYLTAQTVKGIIWGKNRATRWNGSAFVATISNDDWPVGMVVMTEQITSDGVRIGTYVGSFPTAITTTGDYYIEYVVGDSPLPSARLIGVQDLAWTGTGEATLADYVDAIAEIQAKVNTIKTGVITLSNPVSETGTLTIVRGDDYTVATNKAIVFEDTGTTCPDLTGAAVVLTIRLKNRNTLQLSKAGEVLGAREVRFELTHTDTADIICGGLTSTYDVQATLPDGSIVTPWIGDVIIIKDTTI